MDSTDVDLAPVSLSDEQVSHVLPLVYANLRTEHQQIVEKAGGDGSYRTCPDESDPVESFVDRAEERIDRQWNEYGGEPANRPRYLLSAYLERDDSYFELEITVEDVVVSG